MSLSEVDARGRLWYVREICRANAPSTFYLSYDEGPSTQTAIVPYKHHNQKPDTKARKLNAPVVHRYQVGTTDQRVMISIE